MNPPKNTILVSIVCILSICSLFIWGNKEVRTVEDGAFTVLNKGSKAILSSMKGIILSELSRGRFKQDRLEEIIKNIFEELSLSSIKISSDNQVLIQLGVECPSKLSTSPKENIIDNFYYISSTITPRKCAISRNGNQLRQGSKQGRGLRNRKAATQRHGANYGHEANSVAGWGQNNFVNKKLIIILGVDTAEYRKQINEGTHRIYVIVLVGCGALLLLSISYLIAVHSLTLKTELENVKQRNDQYKEFELAAYGLAHETKHPLGIMRARAEHIRNMAKDSDEIMFFAADIMQEADITASRLAEFMSYAKIQKPKLVECNWLKLCKKLDFVLKPEFEDIGASLIFDRSDITLIADLDMLQRVLINLIKNSLNASEKGSVTNINLTRDGDNYTLTVEDNASGIDPKLLHKIFTPYQSGSGDGHGIGLAIVKKIVQAHNWDITVRSELNLGTIFTISNIKGNSNDNL